ncbi:putative ring-cleaving dioxygenase MhqO [Cytophagales bacterium WSM2-2]|nr:putative ring-cleaving dioxygenase MhqO [Cytophagales bacterium WSM2-2]
MTQLVTGIHHVTALADDAQKNVDFYTGILGLRMVKKTINFDAPDVYHLYYGNESGAPGTIMTFFPYSGLVRGRHGKGQMTATSFSAPASSLDYWLKRLDKFKIKHTEPQTRFDNEMFIYLEDVHGLGLELVFNNVDARPGFSYGQIPIEHSVKGFYGVELSEEGYERTASLLLQGLDHKLIVEKGNRFRYSASGLPGDFVDVLCTPESMRGLGGSGTIHHLAFATADDNTQLQAREKLLTKGYNVTPVLDRQYFHSIYFREPGGILFEIATMPPGFAVDEKPAHLGEALKLPPWQESSRSEIEKGLVPIQVQTDKFMD